MLRASANDFPEKKNEDWRHEAESSSSSSTEEPNKSAQADEPNGGWGWMVVTASFFNTFILDGIGSVFGLLYPHILDKFKATAFLTSFAGSLFVSYMIMGSLSACLVGRFGFRLVGIAGGVLCCLSMVTAAFCSNIYTFILTFGLFAGCSTGLVYLPSVVVVNSYFNKKRGLANGIVSSGAGAGLLVLAPVVSWLLTQYSLEGTIFILGGMALNMTMFSCLFFPVRKRVSEKGVSMSSEESSVQFSTDSENVPAGANEKSNGRDAKLPVKENDSSDKQIVDFEGIELENSVLSDQSGSKPNTTPVNANGLTGGRHNLRPISVHSNVQIGLGHKTTDHLLHSTAWGSDHRIAFIKKANLAADETTHYSVDNIAHLSLPSPLSNVGAKQIVQGSNGVSVSHSFQENGSHLYLAGSVSNLQNTQNRYLKRSHVSSLNALSSQLHHSRPKLKGDHDGNEGPNAELNPQLASGHADNDKRLVTETQTLTTDQTQELLVSGTHLDVFVSDPMMADVTLRDLLMRPVFAVFCSGACLIQFGYPVIGTFLADFANEKGMSSNQTALILSLIGCFNIAGRLLGGCFASLGFDLLRLHNVMLVFGAVVCLLCPLYTSFWPLCAFASMFGLFLGFFPPLQPLIIVEYFGLSALGSAFGFLSMVKGLATVCGPPIGGWVYDSCHDYSLSIVFAGSAFLLSAIVHQTMTCFKH